MTEHISKSDYEGIVKSMANNLARTDRERELERAFEKPMPVILRDLHERTGGNRSAMLRSINDRLETWGSETHLSRGTLYNYCDRYLED